VADKEPDNPMGQYGKWFRENKGACEKIIGAPLSESDLQWIRNFYWSEIIPYEHQTLPK
jgi:hypothetical protein